MKCRRSAIFILFLLSVSFLSSNCFAKSNWRLVPSLTLSETYNSNIFSTTKAVEDYITRLSGSVSAIYNGPSVGLSGSYFANFNTYARHPEENVITQNGSFKMDLNRWYQGLVKNGRLSITESFTFTYDLYDYYFDPAQEEIGSLSSYGIRTRRSNSFRNAIKINMSRPITRKTYLTTFYSNILTDFKDPELSDNITNTAGFGIGYSFPKNDVYSNMSVSNVRLGKEDSNNYSLVLGFRRAFSRLMSLDINAGVVNVDRESRDSQLTFRGNLSLSRRSKDHVYHAGYSRSLNTVSGISVHLTTADIIFINMTSIHTNVLTSTIGANYAINRSLFGNKVDVHSYNLSYSLDYKIRKWLKSSLDVSHFKQEIDVSSAGTQDTQRDMITLTFSGTWN